MSNYVSRVGLDPEVALISKSTGLARSAHQFIKEKEVYTFYTDNDTAKSYGMRGSEADRDGAAIEIRSIVDSACRDNIIPYMAEALRQQSLRLEKWKNGEFVLSSASLFTLDNESLKGAPDDVSEFGCQPDFDAYKLQVKSPSCPAGDRRRFTGGHIHLSPVPGKNDLPQAAALAIMFDYFVALPMVAILGEKFSAGEVERRTFYGQPGSFRYNDELQKIEFRTLSGRLMLHPLILGWCVGMARSMVQELTTSPADFVKTKLMKSIAPELVHEVITNHDVSTARKVLADVFKLAPGYREEARALANPLGGGGGGTYNPYFFEQAAFVLAEGSRLGMIWDDDMKFNWGLYENYMPRHHSYWGIQSAMVGHLDADIFPMRPLLDTMWDKSAVQKTPIYTHPLNGGAMKYCHPSAVHWLQ